MSVVHPDLEGALHAAGWLSGSWHHLRQSSRSRVASHAGRGPVGIGASIVNVLRRLGRFQQPEKRASRIDAAHEGFGFGRHGATPWMEVRPRADGDGFVALFKPVAGDTRRATLTDPDEAVAQLTAWRAELPEELHFLFGVRPPPKRRSR